MALIQIMWGIVVAPDTRALTLLKLDGNYSIDGLRKQNKHKHHGLVLLGEFEDKLKPVENWPVFFKKIRCRCHVNKDGHPWGHFALVCQSLAPSAVFFIARKREIGRGLYAETEIVMNSAEQIRINELIGKEINLLELLAELPELYLTLNRLGVRPALCRGNFTGEIVQTVKESKLEKEKHCYDFFINAIYADYKKSLLETYLQKGMSVVEDWGPHLHMRTEFELSEDQSQTLNAPDIVNDLVGTQYFIINTGRYIQEEIKYLIILFCLGMLSRYYPDAWIRMLNSNVLVREVTDSLLSLIHRKLPNLILDQLTDVKHYIHS